MADPTNLPTCPSCNKSAHNGVCNPDDRHPGWLLVFQDLFNFLRELKADEKKFDNYLDSLENGTRYLSLLNKPNQSLNIRNIDWDAVVSSLKEKKKELHEVLVKVVNFIDQLFVPDESLAKIFQNFQYVASDVESASGTLTLAAVKKAFFRAYRKDLAGLLGKIIGILLVNDENEEDDGDSIYLTIIEWLDELVAKQSGNNNSYSNNNGGSRPNNLNKEQEMKMKLLENKILELQKEQARKEEEEARAKIKKEKEEADQKLELIKLDQANKLKDTQDKQEHHKFLMKCFVGIIILIFSLILGTVVAVKKL